MCSDYLRICIVTPEFYTEKYRAGGIAWHSAKVAHWLAAQGHTVHVCVPANEEEILKIRNNLTVHRYVVPNLWHWRFNLFFKRKWRWLPYVEVMLGTRAFMSRLCDEYPFDVIHYFIGHLSLLVSHGRECATVVRSTGYTPEYFEKNYTHLDYSLLLYVWLRKTALKHADAIYTSAHRTARRWEPCIRRRMPVIRTPMFSLEPNPILSKDLSTIKKSKPYVLFCTAMIGCKGADIAAKAMAVVLDRYPEIQFVVTGRDGASPEKGMKMSAYMRRELCDVLDQCHFKGIVDHGELMHWIEYAHFIIAPSRADNLPNLLLETMSLGKVVIGTRDASFDEILEDGVDGFVAENSDVQSLISKIECALDLSSAELERMGKKACEKGAYVFDPDRVLNQLLGVYYGAISRKKD